MSRAVHQREIAPPLDSSCFESMSEWVRDKFSGLSELSFDEAVEWLKESGMNIWDKSIRAVKYLSGAPLSFTRSPPMPSPETKESLKKEVTTVWSFAGMFSSLKGTKKASDERMSRQIGRSFTEGEVHAEKSTFKKRVLFIWFYYVFAVVNEPSSQLL